ncbi:GNAT family N-acetyltransferase [Microbacterium sp. No. 7]|uniref:GNAT family N-acetyltransferase n=1 Tax=Microbacterium sp. No. 7 TaxID=1714373 RepID=UPI0006D0EE27|nr:GNAT family N-acetyltransferase [Microbacterium sp. No. 7]ALJ20133.1 hypothetical protein AOA12_09500 [Microbacterium sp. No. 7]
MRIAIESPRAADVLALLGEHLGDMHTLSPAESVHALDVEALEHPSVTMWSARADDGGALLGVGALKVHDDGTGEVKSMRTAASARGHGVAGALLAEIVAAARAAGLRELNLETGTHDYFAAAQRLYERHGFVARGPFADYADDPHSRYYGMPLGPAA